MLRMQDLHTKAIYRFNRHGIDRLEESIDLTKPNCLDDLASGDSDRQAATCRSAAQDIRNDLSLADEEVLPEPLIADLCWLKASSSSRWKRESRQHSSQLSLDFIFIDQKGDGDAVLGRLIFERIDAQASTGCVYPAWEMEGVHTDADWDGAVEAAIHHANVNGIHIPNSSDLRWKVQIATGVTVNGKREYRGLKSGDKLLGRSAGVTFLLGLSYHFGSHSLDTRRAFQSILALAALPYKDEPDTSILRDLGGQEEKKAEALELLQRTEPHIRRNVLLAARREHTLDSLKGCKERLAGKVAEIFRLLDDILREDRDSPRALDFDDYLQIKRKGFVGREWLFEEMDLWRFKPEERALLITGDPGTGKTSLVAELIHRNPGGRVLGYHCCQSNEIETLRPGRFVQSLAAMIASRLPAYAELLNGEHLTIVLADERCEKDPGGAFLEGVLQPLQKVPAPEDGVRYILVDALDEAVGFSGQRTLPDILASYIQRFPDWLRLVATTRNEPNVMQSLSGLRAKQIDASDPRNQKDLTTYLDQRLSEPSLAERLLASRTTADAAVLHISQKSSGNFLYAVQVLDGIARDDYSFANLDALPRGLDAIYLDFFRRIFGHENTEAGETAYRKAKPLLQILCAALEPLTRAEIAAASQLDPEEELPQILRKLIQLLTRQSRATGEETLTFHHKSVPDWLTMHLDANAFAVSLTKGHKRLAEFCRTAVSDFVTTLPLYARKHAVHHLLQLDDWKGASEISTDIGYLELRAALQELASIRFDYYLLSKKLVIQATTDFEAQTTLHRILIFQKFVASYMAALQQFGHVKNFFCQHAYLLSCENESKGLVTETIAQAGLKRLRARAAAHALKKQRFHALQNSPCIDGSSPRKRTLSDEHHYWSRVLNRAGISTRDITESTGRIAIGYGAVFCAIGSSFVDADPIRYHHAATSRFGNWASEDIGSQPIAGLTLLHAEQSKSLQIGSVLEPFIDLAFTYRSTHLLCLRLMDLTPLKIDPVTKVSTRLPFRGSRLAVAAGANRAATLDHDTIKIWDPETEKLILQISSGNGFNSLALCPSGEYVMAWTNRNLAIWDLMTGMMTCELHCNPGDILHAALDSSGSLLATASKDGIARIWNVRNRTVMAELSGHEGGIRSVHLNQQGTWLYTWGEDQTIRVWRISDQACILLLFQPDACRFSASPDERLIAVGFPDESVEIYEIQNLDAVASTSTAPHLAPARAPTRIGQ